MRTQYATQRATLGVNADDVEIRELRGREHVVAPATMVREMVLKGEFLPFDEIQATALAWNGKPVTVTHPEDDSGNFIPASAPGTFESHAAGVQFDAGPNDADRSLDSTVWIDRERSAEVAESLGQDDPAQMLLDGETVEGSVGYWYQKFDADGEYDGTEFDAVQVGVQPDHFALLPNSKGECSVADGCGVGADAGAGSVAAGTALSALKSLRGAAFGAAQCDCHGHDDETENMTNERIERLAELTAFDADTLEEWDESHLDALEDSIESDEEPEPEPDPEPSANEADPDPGDIAEDITESVMAAVDDRLEEFEQEQQAEERQHLISQIVAHTGDEAEVYEDWGIEQLETLADSVTPSGGVYVGGAAGSDGGGDYSPGASIDEVLE